ncbi:hypothetical protein, partial [Shewanella colwelliana]|uniref:hypothetical protein n=1 Tax=Shewanella colwelliana TaxID=23 RepID=UPI001C317DCA
STMASDVNGFTNAAMTWMSESGHAINVRSCIYTGLLTLFDLASFGVRASKKLTCFCPKMS